jgi:ATP-dependent Clp protease ATP-binding subunit ClpA
MFERFTKGAREVVKDAKIAAEESGDSEVRPEHLLGALLDHPQCLAVRILEDFGPFPDELRAELDRRRSQYGDGLDEDDAEALATIGINLDEVMRRIHDLGGLRRRPGRAVFSRASRKALELALREALGLRHNYIGTEHILLGLARTDDRIVNDTLARWDIQHRALRQTTAEATRREG